MDKKFILSCASTVDMPYSYINGRDIPIIFYNYTVDGVDYPDDMGRDPEALPRFYEILETKMPTTTQINSEVYKDFFRPLLEKGDLLHIAFGSGMSGSVFNAIRAGEELKEEFPDRKIIVIDSLCSSSGYGMLVDYAADMRDEGATIEETAEWVMAHRQRIHHQFFSTELAYYRRSGRMSGATATIATILNICPIMRLDDGGRIIAYDKVRGKKNAIRKTIETMDLHINDGTQYNGKMYVCHSNCYDVAKEFADALKEHYPNVTGEIRICDIGTIIAAHCGPGTVASFFIGDERVPDKKQSEDAK